MCNKKLKKIINITLSLMFVTGLTVGFAGCGKTVATKKTTNKAVAENKKEVKASNPNLSDKDASDAATANANADEIQPIAKTFLEKKYSLQYNDTDGLVKYVSSIADSSFADNFKNVYIEKKKTQQYKSTFISDDITSTEFKNDTFQNKSCQGAVITATVKYKDNFIGKKDKDKVCTDTATLNFVNQNGKWILVRFQMHNVN